MNILALGNTRIEFSTEPTDNPSCLSNAGWIAENPRSELGFGRGISIWIGETFIFYSSILPIRNANSIFIINLFKLLCKTASTGFKPRPARPFECIYREMPRGSEIKTKHHPIQWIQLILRSHLIFSNKCEIFIKRGGHSPNDSSMTPMWKAIWRQNEANLCCRRRCGNDMQFHFNRWHAPGELYFSVEITGFSISTKKPRMRIHPGGHYATEKFNQFFALLARVCSYLNGI